jgi:hypothetical protein
VERSAVYFTSQADSFDRPSTPPSPIIAPFLYNSLITPGRLPYVESVLLKVLAEAIPMSNPSIAAHELLCLYLKSFYGLEDTRVRKAAAKTRPRPRRRGRNPF